MAVWPVIVDSWQIECCGWPPTVGDEVAWMLTLIDSEDEDDPEFVSTIEGRAEPVGQSQHDRYLTVIHGQDVTALWRARSPTRGRVRVRGWLVEDHHSEVPEGMTATRGTVQRIRVVTQMHSIHHEHDRALVPIPGRTWMREVTTSPKSFFVGDLREQESVPIEIGILVDLAVDDSEQ